MKKKTVYEVNCSTLSDLSAAIDDMIGDIGGDARIRDVYFQQDVRHDRLRTIINTDFHIAVEAQ